MDGFGGQGKRRPREHEVQYGHDVTIGLEIDFMDAVKGTTKTVNYEQIEMCTSCKGTGGAKGTGFTTCPTCKGSGNQTVRKDNFMLSFGCSNCKGTGQILKDPCKECQGKGTKSKVAKQSITVPKGADTGTILRIPKMGHLGGDLLVSISVGPHPYFEREGYNIHTNRLISISQAVLGTTINVETLYGQKSIVVKPGTTSGTVLTIPKYGIQKLYPNQYSRGDHYVHIKIKIPSYLNKKQKEAMKAYAEVEDPVAEDAKMPGDK